MCVGNKVLWLFLWIHAILFELDEAMKHSYNHLKVGYEVRSIHSFYFDKGGKLEMHGYVTEADIESTTNDSLAGVEVEQPQATEQSVDLGIYHCTDDEIKNLNQYNSMHKLCESMEHFQCSYSMRINDANVDDIISYSFTSLRKQWMTLVVISCSENRVYDIEKIDLVATSKTGGEYLSLNEVNYKRIYLWFCLLYLLIFALYAVHLFAYRRWNISMQLLLSLYPLIQVLLCFVSNWYWRLSSSVGVPSERLLNACYVVDAIANAYLALALLLICLGWKFMNNCMNATTGTTPFRLKAEMTLIVAVIVCSSALENYYNSLLLFSVIGYILCCRLMMLSYTNNVKLLQSQIELLDMHDREDCPAQIKLDIFVAVKRVIVCFAVLKIIFYWISSLLLMEYPWINDVVLNLSNQIFIVALFYILRMSRPFKPYFYLIDQQYEFTDVNTVKSNKCVNYNLSFQCDFLVMENTIDFIDDDVIINYTLCMPYTIDLYSDNTDDSLHNHTSDDDEHTPLLK